MGYSSAGEAAATEGRYNVHGIGILHSERVVSFLATYGV